MNPDLQEVDTIIESAIAALKIGDSVNVTRLARHAASIAPGSEIAWLLLATVASPQDSLAFVQKALEINPDNPAAQEALAWAKARLKNLPAEEPPVALETEPPQDLESADTADEPETDLEFEFSMELAPSELQPAGEPEVEEGDGRVPAFSSIALQSPELQEAETGTDDPSDLTTTELQASGEAGLDPVADFETIEAQAGAQSSELEAAPEFSAGVPGFLANAVAPRAGTTDNVSAGVQSSASPEQTAKARWAFPESNLAPGRVHAPIRPSSLTSSRAPSKRYRLKSFLSTLVIFIFSASAVVLLAGLLAYIFFKPQLTSLYASFFPAEGCRASLDIGAQSYQVFPLEPGADGSFDVPEDQPDRAYYAGGSASNFVFFLSPASENQTFMTGLPSGEIGSVTWSNCEINTYRLNQPVAQVLDIPALQAQTGNGITIVVPWQGSTSGFVLKGHPENLLLPVLTTPDPAVGTLAPEPTATEAAMPINTPDYSELLAEISLLETTTSADRKSLTVELSIYNYGTLAGTLTGSEVSLTTGEGTALAVVSSEPDLPLELMPGTTQTLRLTFPHPGTDTATVKILNVEFNLEGY